MNIFSSLFGQSKKAILTAKEISLCNSIDYDRRLALLLKEATGSEIELLPAVDEEAQILHTKDKGLCSRTEYKIAFDYVLSEKAQFLEKGYLLFFFEDNSMGIFLSLIKGNDDLEAVKWRSTNGLNFNRRNSYLLDTLREWRQYSQFEIVGVGENHLNIKFTTLPADATKFGEDLCAFCPDIVDNGANNIEALIADLVRTKHLQLWWD